MNQLTFCAMGCEIVVAGVGTAGFGAIRRLFEERESIFSRFRDGTELRRVNAAPAAAVHVSRAFSSAVSTALWAARATDGLVDPTVGAALEAAGYDADFRDLTPDPRPVDAVAASDWRRLHLVGALLVRPPGTVLDLNGVVKAMTVDAAAALLSEPGFVSAGGDIAVSGSPLTVALPGGGAVSLERGGIATSGSATRLWLRGGSVQHHLIDPRTHRPSDSPWTHVTAVGSDCLNADIAAKAGFLLGARGPSWLDHRRIPARFVAPDAVVENDCWARSLVRERTWA